MPARRIIPCLDVKDGRVVKGIQFRDHRDAGGIVEQAARYRQEGADELVFYDISASAEGRILSRDWVRTVAEVIDIPFAVAGGLRSRKDAALCFEAGADKISINSPALERPELITELAREFGSQCVVLGVDSHENGRDHVVYQYTGRPDRSRDTGRRTIDWIREAVDRGAGEIVLNSMQQDGVRSGYDVDHTRSIIEAVESGNVENATAALRHHIATIVDIGPDVFPDARQ